jgi:hypothetical protein
MNQSTTKDNTAVLAILSAKYPSVHIATNADIIIDAMQINFNVAIICGIFFMVFYLNAMTIEQIAITNIKSAGTLTVILISRFPSSSVWSYFLNMLQTYE